MGLCSSIPKLTMRAARRVIKASGVKKNIITQYYNERSCEVVYFADAPVCLTTADFQSPDIVRIHVVEETHDLLVETNSTLYVLSASLCIPTKKRRFLTEMREIDISKLPLLDW